MNKDFEPEEREEVLHRQDQQSQSLEFSQVDEEEPTEDQTALPKDAFVTTSDWTTETIVSQLAKGSIDVSPAFQRRDAWDLKRKRLFIESIFLGIPIPQLVLAEKNRGEYIVLDGKQRLLTLLSFSDFYAPHYDQPLKLNNLPYLKELNRKSWQDLKDDPFHSDLVRAYENAPIRTVLIRNWKREEFLYLIFNRLNTGSLPLSSQELRASLYPGEFTKYLGISSAENRGLQDLLRIKKPDFRMRDAEIQLRATAFDLMIQNYSGSLRDFLNLAQSTFNLEWSKDPDRIRRSTSEFSEALQAILAIFRTNAGRRFTPDGYERTINRAVLDALIFSFRVPELREAALKDPELTERTYEKVCTSLEFALSVQFTTKTNLAVLTRLNMLASAFGSAFSVQMPTIVTTANRLAKIG